MTDKVTNELLEHMEAMRRSLDGLANDVADLKAMAREITTHLSAFMGAQKRLEDALMRVQMRLDRIERRLDLTDEP